MYTDSQVLNATVASTSESSLGEMSIPSGRTYTITSLWCGGVGGTYRISVDTYPSMQGSFVQNASDPTNIGATNKHDTNISITGPATLTGFISNTAATSTSCNLNIQYIDSAGSTN
jgi:hypothetical protein